MKDTEKLVCKDIRKRQEVGLPKYGVTVAENPLNQRQWTQHAYEEAMDLAIYLRRSLQEMDKKAKKKAKEKAKKVKPVKPVLYKEFKNSTTIINDERLLALLNGNAEAAAEYRKWQAAFCDEYEEEEAMHKQEDADLDAFMREHGEAFIMEPAAVPSEGVLHPPKGTLYVAEKLSKLSIKP